MNTHDIDRSPRPFSRMETDEELLVRVRAAGGYRSGSESVDMSAERHRMARRIVWVTVE